MARSLHCDICKKPTQKIVGKLFYTPMVPGVIGSGVHSKYTHHADVGVCCQDRLLTVFNFSERMTAEEYHASRRVNRANVA